MAVLVLAAIAPNPAAADAPMGISGRVTGVDGAALGGVLVDVAVFKYQRGFEVIAETATDSGGRYSVVDLPENTLYVCFGAFGATGGRLAAGYLSQCFHNAPYTYPPSDSSDPVTVRQGQITRDVNARLAAAGGVSGNVFAAHRGGPIAGVEVSVFNRAGDSLGFAVTDRNGFYRATNLTPGTSYAVCFDGSTATGANGSGYGSQCSYRVPWQPASFAGAAAGSRFVPVTAGHLTERIGAELRAVGG